MTHAKTSVVCLDAGRGGQVSVELLLIRALHECYRPISYPGCNGDRSHMRRGCALKLRSCLVSQSKRGTPVLIAFYSSAVSTNLITPRIDGATHYTMLEMGPH